MINRSDTSTYDQQKKGIKSKCVYMYVSVYVHSNIEKLRTTKLLV